MKNQINTIGLSFDIEDWFCVRNMRDIIPFAQWNKMESRIHIGTNFLLGELKKRNIKATFFVLGWIAERAPELVQNISNDGHEIASHGHSHKPLTLMSKKEFSKDLEKSLDVLTRVTSREIRGFRAPSFSITQNTYWAFKILNEQRIKYDSSIYPTHHPDYGIRNFGTQIKKIDGVIELPLSTSSFMGLNIPISGGGYFRLFPYDMFRFLINRPSTNEQVTTYFHPWEFDNHQPRIRLPLMKKFRHYVGLNSNRSKFERFLDDKFKFTSLENLLIKKGHLSKLSTHTNTNLWH